MARKNLLDFKYTCQKCGKRKESTRERTYKTKNYMGPCGDSFCYHSCDMDTCHPATATICDACCKKLSLDEKAKK